MTHRHKKTIRKALGGDNCYYPIAVVRHDKHKLDFKRERQGLRQDALLQEVLSF